MNTDTLAPAAAIKPRKIGNTVILSRLVALHLAALSGVISGCQTHTLSDGTLIRTDHFPGVATPSVTTVTVRPAGTTNWGVPQVVSSPGVIGQAASGVAVVIPFDRESGGNSTTTINNPPAPKPPTTWPPGHRPKERGNRGR